MIYAMGLLSQTHPDAALRIAKKYLKPVTKAEVGAHGETVTEGYANRANLSIPSSHGEGLMTH